LNLATIATGTGRPSPAAFGNRASLLPKPMQRTYREAARSQRLFDVVDVLDRHDRIFSKRIWRLPEWIAGGYCCI
jgi:hypothetical protein